jgi:hypothetical protein
LVEELEGLVVVVEREVQQVELLWSLALEL